MLINGVKKPPAGFDKASIERERVKDRMSKHEISHADKKCDHFPRCIMKWVKERLRYADKTAC